ncbi:enoyl-ACP reductase FabI [Streptomyces sp. MUM 203J]|uniref:enoyl-ACP reductase FabI n=1 Tax=Streptomyces sp. MUM 203J TaxID=2791990 RepID=UPI001F04CF4E|nr:enoyl-ACP reductase FabI [Streptomyces sp. MUM 203J]MCH0539688.1 enoyl-ACP reductase FabI [Streptomyces sp. MUM 203J]
MLLGFEGRRYLVTGVLNDDSIAWHTARALQEAGADVVLTGFGRTRRITEAAASGLPYPAEVLELDVTRPEDPPRVAEELGRRWGSLDGVLHAVAAAPRSALSGNFLTASAEDAAGAFHTAAFSLQSLTAALVPLLSGARGNGGGSVVGLDFDASGAWPGYDWMGVSKAALGAVCRYLALYVGGAGIRVNLVAAGPVETVAGRAISTFDAIAGRWERDAPLGWDRADTARPVGPVLFLLSDLSAAVTGEIVHADGGMHAVRMGARTLEES